MSALDFVTVSLTRIECCNCHTIFAMTTDMEKQRRNDKLLFYCPAGHSQYFPGRTEADRLKSQLSLAENNATYHRERAAHLEHSRNATKGAMTKLKKRINAGVCPHCSRSFKSLRDHIAHMHPDAVNAKADVVSIGAKR